MKLVFELLILKIFGENDDVCCTIPGLGVHRDLLVLEVAGLAAVRRSSGELGTLFEVIRVLSNTEAVFIFIFFTFILGQVTVNFK